MAVAFPVFVVAWLSYCLASWTVNLSSWLMTAHFCAALSYAQNCAHFSPTGRLEVTQVTLFKLSVVIAGSAADHGFVYSRSSVSLRGRETEKLILAKLKIACSCVGTYARTYVRTYFQIAAIFLYIPETKNEQL